jgi:hypothetical protein
MKAAYSILIVLTTTLTATAQQPQYEIRAGRAWLTAAGAAHFADLPLRCMQREFPYKTGISFTDSTLAVKPRLYHPAFYGCFDWHSSVHGHWMLVRLLKLFPDMPRAEEIRGKLKENLSAANIRGEMRVFGTKDNESFERTYGWAWLLQLQNELLTWNDPLSRELSSNVAPLAHLISRLFCAYLPKMNLVHLDGLNLSRAWDLYGIARHFRGNRDRLYELANRHLTEALPHVASGDYMGEHWLASFAVYALTMQ